ncbi:hypothetical protein GLOIN_2v1779027 [Rhizophagus irregularis DAOM 181602=DAOM 197198]|nr:hypothetical protein GLOIN_2v1779027 [Rhizophagus irregularis DAOM 181602=DAOM 197198]
MCSIITANTKASIKNWITLLEKFYKKAGFIEKIDEIATEAEVASSVQAAIAAIRQHLINNSVIEGVDVQQKSLFPNLWKVFNRKIQYLLDFSLNEPKGSDALTVDKIIQIFNHQKMDSSTLRRLLYQIFFYNAILLELRGKEYFKLDGK